eukprot:1808742-Prymnesium_polylepis.3
MDSFIHRLCTEGPEAERPKIVLLEQLVRAIARHQHSQEGRPRLEDADLSPLDDVGKAIRRRYRRPFEQHRREAAQQRRREHVGLACGSGRGLG